MVRGAERVDGLGRMNEWEVWVRAFSIGGGGHGGV